MPGKRLRDLTDPRDRAWRADSGARIWHASLGVEVPGPPI